MQAPYVICPTQSILSRFDPAPRRLANNNNNNGGPSVRAFGLVNFSRSNGLHLSTRVPFGPVCSSAPFLLLFFFAFFEPSATEIKKRNAIYLSTDFSKKKRKSVKLFVPNGHASCMTRALTSGTPLQGLSCHPFPPPSNLK